MSHSYIGNIRELGTILLRALFFRSGKMISGEDIRRAINAGTRDQASPATERLADEIAGRQFLIIRHTGRACRLLVPIFK